MATKRYVSASDVNRKIAAAKERYHDLRQHVGAWEAVQGLRADLPRITKAMRAVPEQQSNLIDYTAFRELQRFLKLREKMLANTPRGRAAFLKPLKKIKIRYQIGKRVV